jgi:hypothetical protein
MAPCYDSIVRTVLDYTRRNGFAPDSAVAFAAFGIVLWQENKLRESFAMGKLAHMLLHRMGDAARTTLPRVNTPVLSQIYPWHYPLRECLPMYEAAFAEAMALGDSDWASYLSVHVGE